MKTSTLNHTPVKWHVIEPEGTWPLIADERGRLIAKVDTSLNGDVLSLPEARANAHLLASAPSLLAQNKRLREAVEFALKFHNMRLEKKTGDHFPHQLAHALRAALNEPEVA